MEIVIPAGFVSDAGTFGPLPLKEDILKAFILRDYLYVKGNRREWDQNSADICVLDMLMKVDHDYGILLYPKWFTATRSYLFLRFAWWLHLAGFQSFLWRKG